MLAESSPRYMPPVIQPKTSAYQGYHAARNYKPKESMMAPILGAHRSYSIAMPPLQVNRLQPARDVSPLSPQSVSPKIR